MTHTSDYEHVLDLDNVVGVEYDEDEDKVVSFVTKKRPLEELDETQIVANAVDRQSDVIEIGELSAQTEVETQAKGDRQDRIRPVPGGVSEMNINGSAATGGPYPVKVTDTAKGKWDDEVTEGDIVRLSNAHVYARSNRARLGEPVTQPSPYDGGGAADEVGRLAGYVPVEDGITVDVAARTITDESSSYHLLDEKYEGKMFDGNYKDLKGDKLIKTGRTTGVLEAPLLATTASVKVNYGGDVGTITCRDMLVTGFMSEGGDSGSPTFVKETGELVGQLFAGSPKATIHHKMTNVEQALGVEIMTETEDNTNEKKYVESLKTTVSIEMEKPDLDLVGMSGDKPESGETVTAVATVVGNYDGDAYLDVQDERYEFSVVANTETDVDVEYTAPDEHQEEFDLDITGGYIR